MNNALILIDVQKEYQIGGALECDGFDKAAVNISALLNWAREGQATPFHVKHISSDSQDSMFLRDAPRTAFAQGFEPHQNELVFEKSMPSAFTCKPFETALSQGAFDHLIICGYSSFLCCDSTCRDAYHKGYDVTFVEDAIGEFAISPYSETELHAYTCAVLGVEFATILQTRDVIA